MGERLRLFVAVDVPDDHLARVEGVTAELRKRLAGARWTPPANQHITLKFLGATAEDDLPDVKHVCAGVAGAHSSAMINLSGLGAFPNARRARVVWMGINDPDDLLGRLAAALDEGLRVLGFAAEERAYTPHLTLARLKSPAPVGDLATTLPEADWEPIEVDHLSLYRSRLSPRGAVYELLEKFPLALR
ncbi:MAG: 2,3-cyclic 3-phosphodiesterase [Actinomycetota bacterium]|nr:2,3-cyclic 3-phosphodiesterase [Actinomycetota bacterium]